MFGLPPGDEPAYLVNGDRLQIYVYTSATTLRSPTSREMDALDVFFQSDAGTDPVTGDHRILRNERVPGVEFPVSTHRLGGFTGEADPSGMRYES